MLHSVVRAATTSPEILDQIIRAGADISEWLEVPTRLPRAGHLTHSGASVATPLHAAIATRNTVMVQALLDRGFNPNAQALIAGSQALTPAQFAIVTEDFEAYSILEKHPQFDPSVLTPVFKVHTLHFAVSLLNPEALNSVNCELSDAPLTALGHSLLHVACLPATLRDIQNTEKITKKVTEARTLITTSRPNRELSFSDSGERITPEKRSFQYPLVDHLERLRNEMSNQTTICKRMVTELGAAIIGLADVHGFTALHYLAGMFCTNKELITWLRAQDGGEEVWCTTKSMYGDTAQDMFDESEAKSARRQCGYHYCGALSSCYNHRHLDDGAFMHPSGRGPRGRGRVMRAVHGRWTYQ